MTELETTLNNLLWHVKVCEESEESLCKGVLSIGLNGAKHIFELLEIDGNARLKNTTTYDLMMIIKKTINCMLHHLEACDQVKCDLHLNLVETYLMQVKFAFDLLDNN